MHEHEAAQDHAKARPNVDVAREATPDVPSSAGEILNLQRTIGNAAVSDLLDEQEERSPVLDVVGSSGRSLDDSTRQTMESRLGHDFSDVQIHDDASAGESARSVNASAYTSGTHVVLDPAKHTIGSEDTTRTLAHELTHVVQQKAGPVDGTDSGDGLSVSHPSDRFEREASSAADAVMSGGSPAVAAAPASGTSVQRQEEEEEPVQTLSLQRQEGEEEEVQE